MIGVSAMAQDAVVKEAERAMKKNADYKEVVKIMTPAFTDPTTQNHAQTYYIPGKAAFNQFDNLIAREALGQLPANGKETKVECLLGGYDYFMKALPLDSLPDEKGKVKPKYSKDMVNTIAGHYNDFNAAAVDFWDLKQYDNAYRAWDIYLALPNIPAFAKQLPFVPNDTVMGEISFNQALAGWQMNDLEKSLASFLKAKSLGYSKKPLYDYAIAVATQLGKNDVVTALATEANDLYGEEDSNYIGYIVNACIQESRYNDAVQLLDKAIAQNPQNAQYHVIKGILFEQDGVEGDSKAEYQIAYDLDNYNPQAVYNLGRMLYNEALEVYNNAPTDEAEFSRIYATEFKPMMKKAVDMLENAYNLDNENTDSLKLLQQAYYMLNDEANLNDVNARLGQ